ncbi:hypothetical protein [uncultured Serinicoccus sp.]|uniref:hypothetical protein n=1 Tax=uncultured Serinicoccus sp. TaxID=735514 RepID=UPI002635494E|nr:hypothetical protein [uncultured Serinicoccus sp.]
MTIIGEDLPDVEDTTVEELRAQQEQLEQARRDLAERAREERERAEQQLAAERRRAERELARRQREIDDAERRLLRTERRLRQEAASSGRGVDLPPRPRRRAARRSDSELLDAARAELDTRVPRLGFAAALALGAGLLLALGSTLSADRVEQEQTQTFTVLETAQADLRDAVSSLDTELVRYATGDPVPLDDAGQLASVTAALEVLGREGIDPYAAERLAEAGPELSGDAVSPVRAATSWQDTRQDMAYAVSPWEVEDEVEELAPGSALGTLLLWAGALVLVVAAVVLLRAGARVASAFFVLAALATSLLVVQDAQPGWRRAVVAHEEAADRPADLQSVVEDDLEILVGLRTLAPWETEDDDYGYWTTEYRLEESGADPDGTVAQARADLGRALTEDGSQQQQRTAALDLVAAADEAREPLEADLVTARETVVVEATTGPSAGLLGAGLGLAVLLPFAGLGAESLTRRRKETP